VGLLVVGLAVVGLNVGLLVVGLDVGLLVVGLLVVGLAVVGLPVGFARHVALCPVPIQLKPGQQGALLLQGAGLVQVVCNFRAISRSFTGRPFKVVPERMESAFPPSCSETLVLALGWNSIMSKL